MPDHPSFSGSRPVAGLLPSIGGSSNRDEQVLPEFHSSLPNGNQRLTSREIVGISQTGFMRLDGDSSRQLSYVAGRQQGLRTSRLREPARQQGAGQAQHPGRNESTERTMRRESREDSAQHR